MKKHKKHEVYRTWSAHYDGQVDTFDRKVCMIEGCQHAICPRLSDDYCYPHSAWYRPIIVKFRRLIIYFQDLYERLFNK